MVHMNFNNNNMYAILIIQEYTDGRLADMFFNVAVLEH